MASTNKTANYNLSQYVGTDKPTYLSDYNTDMFNIDAQMKVNADNVATAISGIETATTTANTANTNAQTAISTANSASTTAGEANTTATNAQTTANSALATATTAQSTANTANTNALNAQASADAMAQKLTLVNFETVPQSSVTRTGSGNLTSFNIYTATNADGSWGKIYGNITISANNSNGKVVFPTQLRPKDNRGVATDLTIDGICENYLTGSTGGVKWVSPQSVTIKANGNIEIDYGYYNSGDDNNRISIFASLLFLTPFNDEPIPGPTPGE